MEGCTWERGWRVGVGGCGRGSCRGGFRSDARRARATTDSSSYLLRTYLLPLLLLLLHRFKLELPRDRLLRQLQQPTVILIECYKY